MTELEDVGAKLDKLILKQAVEILDYLELLGIANPKVPFKERVSALNTVANIRKDFRRGEGDDDKSGSAVRKYATSFANAQTRRASYTRSPTDAAAADGAGVHGDDDASDRKPS